MYDLLGSLSIIPTSGPFFLRLASFVKLTLLAHVPVSAARKLFQKDMQSIGMTNRQLRKMMISESFSYVLLAGIVGTLVAVTLGMTLLRAFVENGPTSMMMTFQITLLPALIMLVLFLVLAFIVPVVALRLLNNRSVVERLRVNE